MKKITDIEFGNSLTNKPLYYKIKIIEGITRFTSDVYMDHYSFKDKPFKFFCPYDKEVHTFRTAFSDLDHMSLFGFLSNDENKLPITFNEKTHLLDFTIHLKGICQSCKNSIDFLIRVTSDKEWERRKEGLNIYMQKIGQYPPFETTLNKNLEQYLSKDDQINYKRALSCLSISYGIGSYAYLRRIIENEITLIIRDISELEFDGADKVRDAYKSFQNDHQMSKLINILNKHLPLAFQELGDNPIKLLYDQLSGGIHDFTDGECLEKASSIDLVLNYVIKKINEEKYQLKELKNALRKLKNNNS